MASRSNDKSLSKQVQAGWAEIPLNDVLPQANRPLQSIAQKTGGAANLSTGL